MGDLNQDLHQFSNSFIGRAMLLRVAQASHGVFPDDHHRDLVSSAPDGSQLDQDVMAIAVLFDHSTHAPGLPLDALQPFY